MKLKKDTTNIENIKMYCSNRDCPYFECVRHDRNIPFNVLIKREDFKIGLAEIHYVFSIVNECEYK